MIQGYVYIELTLNPFSLFPDDVTTESKRNPRKKKFALDPVPDAVKEVTKTQSNSKVHVPNVFQASLEGSNGKPVGDLPFEPSSGEEKNERPRSGSETTDWVTIKKEAEGDRSQGH